MNNFKFTNIFQIHDFFKYMKFFQIFEHFSNRWRYFKCMNFLNSHDFFKFMKILNLQTNFQICDLFLIHVLTIFLSPCLPSPLPPSPKFHYQWIYSERPVEEWKHAIVDNNLPIQPFTFSQIRSLRYLKVPFFGCPASVGIPRYLSLNDSFRMWRFFLNNILNNLGATSVEEYGWLISIYPLSQSPAIII